MKFIAAALGVLLASAAAYGQGSLIPKGFFYEEPKFYIGGAFATGTGPDDEREWAGREAAFGGKISGAWEPSRFFAIEGAFGYWRVDEDPIPNITFFEETQAKHLTSLQLGIIGRVAIDQRFSILGRIGAHNWRMDTGADITVRRVNLASSDPSVPPLPADVVRIVDNDDGTDLFYGIGLELNTRSHAWRFGISATRYENPYRISYFLQPLDGSRGQTFRVEEGSHTDIFEFSIKRVF